MLALTRNPHRLARCQLSQRLRPGLGLSPQRRPYLEWPNRSHFLESWTVNETLRNWVNEQIAHLQPSRVHLCDGSIQENNELSRMLVAQGALIQLNEKLRPNSFLARSHKSDVARLEDSTFICSESPADAGPMNNWKDPLATTRELHKLTVSCMRGRTMYVLPFCMGPIKSDFSRIGIQITDSPLVVLQMGIMTRTGLSVVKKLGEHGEFVPCIHSVGAPLDRSEEDSVWPCNSQKMVVHFPEQQRIVSFGSGYGGNALLGKKCLGLRLASFLGREEGWLAEHMLVVGVTNPAGRKKYFAAAFPSACGKTNMAMLRSLLPGWRVQCLGDDIAWLRLAPDGRLFAMNPECGFFGVAPGTSRETNPHMMKTIERDTIYTNVALTGDRDVWWEGLTKKRPSSLVTWLRRECKSDDRQIETSHANSRFCTSMRNCPALDPKWDDPAGVPIDAIIFGGRRSSTVPLVTESRNWRHGVFMGATMGSETTAAAVGRRGLLRFDPFAMRPFCGYNMADYFSHWLSFEKRSAQPSKLPRLFGVNWFRKQGNRVVWPGFGENVRVLKWIYERCDGASRANGEETAVGTVPSRGALDTAGLALAKEDLEFLVRVDRAEWGTEVERVKEFFASFRKHKMPAELLRELGELQTRLSVVEEEAGAPGGEEGDGQKRRLGEERAEGGTQHERAEDKGESTSVRK